MPERTVVSELLIPADAEAGKAISTLLHEDDNIMVNHVRFRPGDVAASVTRPRRISLALKGGTLTKVFPDGHTEDMTYEDKQFRVNPPAPVFAPKNNTSEEIQLYVITLKGQVD
ncbi:hypothetical protein [Streptomyces sp. NPDC005549]|uniref:hypothetical protein n=1 Tax=Streptomyces sp. NPDC005549 TaxID=3154888 RepID=UPI0033AB99CA